MPTIDAETPFYFTRTGAGFMPGTLSRNPWFADAVAGGPIAALIGTVIEDAGFDDGFEICRISIDILGIVPRALLTPKVSAVREGRQAQLHRVELFADDRLVTQAHVLRARTLETPPSPAPFEYPDPSTLKDGRYFVGASMEHALQTKAIAGGVSRPGRGTVWVNSSGQVIKGEPSSAFVKACMFADYGNGVGSATKGSEWSFANLDITIQFFRMPRGEWFLIDAETQGAGNGHALTQSIFADREGVYAKGTQTIFVAPGVRG
jgi:hypothetical protein